MQNKYSYLNSSFKGFVVNFVFSYSLTAVLSSNVSTSEMCLDQALTIHAMMKQKQCPYDLLNAVSGYEGCSAVYKGHVRSKNELHDEPHCVGLNINFHLNDNLSTNIIYFLCNITNCILEVIDFECSLGDKTDEDAYIAPAISVVLSLSCASVGSLLGMGCLIVVQRLRKYKQKLDTTVYTSAVLYQPKNATNIEHITIPNLIEEDYENVEVSIKMIAKAVQVPSYKDDSSSESGSRENIHQYSKLSEQSPKIEKSMLFTNDSDSFLDSHTPLYDEVEPKVC
ncbi:uncharacterized protein LOC111106305 isoform X1 [Crassostrea virginica]